MKCFLCPNWFWSDLFPRWSQADMLHGKDREYVVILEAIINSPLCLRIQFHDKTGNTSVAVIYMQVSKKECATLKNEKHLNSAVCSWNIFVYHKNVLDSLNYIHGWQLTCNDTRRIWAQHVVAGSTYSMYKNVNNIGTWFIKPTTGKHVT